MTLVEQRERCRRVTDLGENTNQFKNNSLNFEAFRILGRTWLEYLLCDRKVELRWWERGP